MTTLVRGALVEYGSDFLGPLPNVVLFQFNPEGLTRTIEIPERPTGSTSRESSQAGDTPVESITLTAKFDASDRLAVNDPLARKFGIGPALAALEQMVQPNLTAGSALFGMLNEAVEEGLDKIGALFAGKGDATQSVPREEYPRILFIWGENRVLPVLIQTMTITEKWFDHRLNALQGEVTLKLDVVIDPWSDDEIAKGALDYTISRKKMQARLQLVAAVKQELDIVSF